MKARSGLAWLAALALIAVLHGCVVSGDGYAGYDGPVAGTYNSGFYQPYGYAYGGWGPGYYVGPPRGGVFRSHRSPPGHYRPAPPSRPVPSIPRGPRPGPSHRR